MGGISRDPKSLSISHIVAVSKLHQLGKLPNSPWFDTIVKELLPKVAHKLTKAHQMLLCEDKQQT